MMSGFQFGSSCVQCLHFVSVILYNNNIKMKFLAALLPLVTIAVAQRPPYAGTRPIGVPELANRFRVTEQSTASTTNVPLGNRLGENDVTTKKLPVDALGDVDLVNRLEQWPKSQQPFWLLNADAIEAHRRQQPSINLESRFTGSETIPAKPAGIRSPFAGSSRF